MTAPGGAPAPGPAGPAGPVRTRPEITLDNQFFWKGVDEHQLLVQRCSDCGHERHPPSPRCPACLCDSWQAVPYPLEAEVYSFTVVHRPAPAGFEPPYAVALLQWPSGIRFLTDLRGVEPSEVAIGMPVTLRFEEVEPGYTLPVAYPTGEDAGEGAGGVQAGG